MIDIHIYIERDRYIERRREAERKDKREISKQIHAVSTV